MTLTGKRRDRVAVLVLAVLWLAITAGPGLAAGDAGTDFAGTVLKVDPAYNKLTVMKEGGGARFTFVVDDKTQFEGAAFKALKKGDAVVVRYVMSGSTYLAQKVSKK